LRKIDHFFAANLVENMWFDYFWSEYFKALEVSRRNEREFFARSWYAITSFIIFSISFKCFYRFLPNYSVAVSCVS